jgi:4-amino-4-deoxy-L-arabinose transferase-like glycosyltransferase
MALHNFEETLTGKNVTRWLMVIIIVGLLLRIGSAIYMGNQVQALPGIYDQISYDQLAQRLLAGHGFSFGQDWWPLTRAGEPTAHWSYLMTLYLYVVYLIFGHHPLVARLIQAVAAGILMPWLTFRLGKRMGNTLVGLIAAAISAVYIYFFYYAAALMTETFFFLAVLFTLNLSIDFAQKPGWKTGVWLGLALGCGVLLRQEFLIFVPFIVGWIIWSRRGRMRYRYFLAIFGIVIVMILPFTIRNYVAFKQFVLLNTNSGYVFFWSNHPIQGTNFKSLLPENDPTYQQLIPVELRSLNEAALDSALMKLGIQFVLDDPVRFILLSISRLKDFFLFWPQPQSGLLSNLSRVGSFGIFLPFMVYGLVLALWPGRLEKIFNGAVDRGVYLLVYLFMLVFSAIHLLSWAYVRYRLPVDTTLIIFAALAFFDILYRFMRRREKVASGPELD